MKEIVFWFVLGISLLGLVIGLNASSMTNQELNTYSSATFNSLNISDLYIAECNSTHKVIAYDVEAATNAGCNT